MAHKATETEADGGRPRETTEGDVLQAFDDRADPCEPLTAGEVGDRVDCSRRTAFDILERLADAGDIETKKIGARARVWWVPEDGEGGER